MSSSEDENNDGDSPYQTTKKRRTQRACDVCRRKKIRCDGVQLAGSRCSNCISCNLNCTYVEAAKKRGPPRGYVEKLERRVEKLEKLLRRLCPDEMLYNELISHLDGNWSNERPPINPSALVSDIASKAQPNAALETVTSAIRGAIEDKFDPAKPDPNDDDDPSLILADNLRRMAISPSDCRFFGKSSGVMLIRTAIELKNEYAGQELDLVDPEKPMMKNQRQEFWAAKPWEQRPNVPVSTQFNFPDMDLAQHCIDLYFKCSNLYLPLLHRPTFEKNVKEGLHLSDGNFAPVFLLVCAVGAQYSYDPRVLWDGTSSYHSSGWKWFNQVQTMMRSLMGPPSLYDLQVYCLCIQFLLGSSAPQSCWTMVGVGIRLAQDVGAHRRKVHDHTLTPEDELWKRAFWVLLCMDRIVSSCLGRPCAIQEEDFDLDLPVDCDDEYWDHPDPEKRFKQPPNKPSSVTAFILCIKLQQILALSLRTIYAIGKSNILLGVVEQQWEQHVVAELDSALNKWADSVPDHLRWDPKREDDSFFNQSVYLYATYYYIQIVIHRPFIPSSGKPSPLSFPSLAMCTNAARSCARILDIQANRNNDSPPQMQMTAFTAGIVLLLSIWGAKRAGLSTDPKKEMVEVHKCMLILKSSEARWHVAGRLWDILYNLASMGELPLPQPCPPSGTKRERESDSPSSVFVNDSPLHLLSENDLPRSIAGSRRVNKEPPLIQQMEMALPHNESPPQNSQRETLASSPTHKFRLNARHLSQVHSQPQPHIQTREIPELGQTFSGKQPLTTAEPPLSSYSNELGREPLDGHVTFSAQVHSAQVEARSPLDHKTNYWYTVPSSSNPQDSGRPESTSHTGPSGAGSSYGYGLPYPPAAALQHPIHPLRHQGVPSGMLPSASEMSSLTQGPYGEVFESPTTAYIQPQQTSTYGLRSIVPETGSSMENAYRGMGMDTMLDGSGGHHQHPQPQGVPQQHEQQSLSHPGAIWSNVPVGFELDQWGAYLTNIAQSTQGNVHPHLP